MGRNQAIKFLLIGTKLATRTNIYGNSTTPNHITIDAVKTELNVSDNKNARGSSKNGNIKVIKITSVKRVLISKLNITAAKKLTVPIIIAKI